MRQCNAQVDAIGYPGVLYVGCTLECLGAWSPGANRRRGAGAFSGSKTLPFLAAQANDLGANLASKLELHAFNSGDRLCTF